MSDFIFPKRQGFHQNARLKQDVERDSCHIKGSGGSIAMSPVQHHGNVSVALRMVGVAGATAEQNTFAHGIKVSNALHEDMGRAFRLRIECDFGPARKIGLRRHAGRKCLGFLKGIAHIRNLAQIAVKTQKLMDSQQPMTPDAERKKKR